MLLGAHVSIAGGYVNAAIEAGRLGMDAIQIFTKNQRFWKEKDVSAVEGQVFKEACKAHGVKQAFSHAIYLISLGSENPEIVEKSALSLALELQRCQALGLTHTVLHPGSAGTLPPDKAISNIAGHLKAVLGATPKNPAKILLENTAGSGSSVGGKIEYLGEMVRILKSKRVGICIDTCHAFAAGYDIRTKKGLDAFFKLIENEIGLDRLLCFHLNDSKGDLGSKLDRHANIGEGKLGLEPFRYIIRNFPHVPKVIETPKEDNADERNLAVLRSLSKVGT